MFNLTVTYCIPPLSKLREYPQPCEASPSFLLESGSRLTEFRWPVGRWRDASCGSYWAESGPHFCNWICMAVSDTPCPYPRSYFTLWFLPLIPFYLISPLTFHHLHLLCIPAFHTPFPSVLPYITPYLLFPPISFTRTGLQLISAAGCGCFHCCTTSQQMCINRPSGVVIANKVPVCVCRKGELLP